MIGTCLSHFAIQYQLCEWSVIEMVKFVMVNQVKILSY